MNLLLFSGAELSPDNILHLPAKDRRALHILNVLKLKVGDPVKVGRLDGDMGTGTIIEAADSGYRLRIELTQPPPPALDLTLVLALPRPKMMRRVVQTIASLGVKKIVLINAYKVEKSYWQSPWLQPDVLNHHCQLGLEQACDTLMPSIELRKLFKPFVEDELPALTEGRSAWVAHPGTQPEMPDSTEPLLLTIGPEGGFTPYEVGKLNSASCRSFSFGPRVLRVETVIPALLGRLYL